MKKVLKFVYWILGAGMIGYYFLLWHSARFGLSLSWIWLIGGGACIAAGFAVQSARIPRWVHIAWRTILCTGLALTLALECVVVSGMREVPPKNLDYLIVLGARVENGQPSRALSKRIRAAQEYLEENPNTRVIVSGGQGPDESVSEAECMRQAFVRAGISEDRILMEDQSKTTAENIRFSKALLPSADVSVAVVTNNFHVARAMLLAKKAGMTDVHGLSASYRGYTLPHYMIREAIGMTMDFLNGDL